MFFLKCFVIMFCKIKFNFIKPDKNHYLNFIVVYNFDIKSPIEVGKTYLIGTKILLLKETAFTIKLESLTGVKYKYLIRKYLKEHFKVKVKNIKIKHINNNNNNHNYLVLVTKLNKQLKKIKNRISSCDELVWKNLYEIFSPITEKELEKKTIYKKLSEKTKNIYKCQK